MYLKNWLIRDRDKFKKIYTKGPPFETSKDGTAFQGVIKYLPLAILVIKELIDSPTQ